MIGRCPRLDRRARLRAQKAERSRQLDLVDEFAAERLVLRQEQIAAEQAEAEAFRFLERVEKQHAAGLCRQCGGLQVVGERDVVLRATQATPMRFEGGEVALERGRKRKRIMRSVHGGPETDGTGGWTRTTDLWF